jgi:acyl dehydratase
LAIDYDKLKAWHFPEIVQTYTERDCILYALGLGLGWNPVDPAQLAYVWERNLRVLPTFGLVLAKPAFWQKDPATGIDWRRMLHGEEGIVLHRPLPHSATVSGRTRICAIVDKGQDRGALIGVERVIREHETGDPLATVTSTIFCRGDGGFGNREDRLPAPHPLPERAPDAVVTSPTVNQTALVYRLLGGENPIHVDPDLARQSGFERPILQGLCLFGIATQAAITAFCDGEPNAVRELHVRFTAPAYPGETIRTELWRDGDVVSFRAFAQERSSMVLSNGRARIDAAARK